MTQLSVCSLGQNSPRESDYDIWSDIKISTTEYIAGNRTPRKCWKRTSNDQQYSLFEYCPTHLCW